MNFAQIDFSQAWIRHSMFKTRLRAYLLTGNGETKSLTDAAECSLGSWLKEVVGKYAVSAHAVLEVSYLHEEIHAEAGRVISLYRQNKLDEARNLLTFIELKDAQIFDALNTLQREIAA